MKKQPFQDDLDSPSSLHLHREGDDDPLTSGLDHSDDEDDRHYGNDLDNDDHLFFRER